MLHSTNAVRTYMRSIITEEFDPMSKKEEQDLLQDKTKTEDEKTHILVQRNVRLVSTIAKKYINVAEFDDLMQEGILGLYQAAEKFDPTKNVKFCTYAYFYIFKVIQTYLKTENRAFGSVRNHAVYSFNDVIDQTEPNKLEFEVDHSVYNKSTSTYIEVLNNEVQVISNIFKDILEDVLLTDREKLVIKKRFLTDSRSTLKALGKTLGVSHSMVKYIETAAVGKLRNHVRSTGITKNDIFQNSNR